MSDEPDIAPPLNTFRRFVWQTVTNLSYLRAFWGRRWVGGGIGLLADMMGEAATQAFYARLPGHPQQAADSLAQVGLDRDLHRFRGETDDNWLTRVQEAWDDYAQGGTKEQVLKVVNQWGNAGWPATWDNNNVTLDESVIPTVFEFDVTIAYGNIVPPWAPEVYGVGDHVYGEVGFFYGLSADIDIAMLRYIVHKWKPSRSLGRVIIFYSVSNSVTVIV